MKRLLKTSGLLLGIAVLLAAFPGYRFFVEARKSINEDPAVYAEDITDLVARSRECPVPEDAVVFIESSRGIGHTSWVLAQRPSMGVVLNRYGSPVARVSLDGCTLAVQLKFPSSLG